MYRKTRLGLFLTVYQPSVGYLMSNNTLGKGMNPNILPPAMGK